MFNARDIVPKTPEVNIPEITLNGLYKKAAEKEAFTPADLHWMKINNVSFEQLDAGEAFNAPTGPKNFSTSALEGSASEGLDLVAPPDIVEAAEQGSTIEDIYSQAVANGDLDAADKALDLAMKQQEAVNSFSEDLTPEAMLSDRFRAFQERRDGKTPSMQLTKSGAFGGEKRSAFDLAENADMKNFGKLMALGKNRRAEKSSGMNERMFNMRKIAVKRDIITQMHNMERQLKADKLKVKSGKQIMDMNNLKVYGGSINENIKNLMSMADMFPDDDKKANVYIDEAQKWMNKRNDIYNKYKTNVIDAGN